jgi:hypothetical protein
MIGLANVGAPSERLVDAGKSSASSHAEIGGPAERRSDPSSGRWVAANATHAPPSTAGGGRQDTKQRADRSCPAASWMAQVLPRKVLDAPIFRRPRENNARSTSAFPRARDRKSAVLGFDHAPVLQTNSPGGRSHAYATPHTPPEERGRRARLTLGALLSTNISISISGSV